MDEWSQQVVEALELQEEPDVGLVLQVAKDVAHGVLRPAAPVTTYLLGVAVGRGADPAEAARRIAQLVEEARARDSGERARDAGAGS